MQSYRSPTGGDRAFSREAERSVRIGLLKKEVQ